MGNSAVLARAVFLHAASFAIPCHGAHKSDAPYLRQQRGSSFQLSHFLQRNRITSGEVLCFFVRRVPFANARCKPYHGAVARRAKSRCVEQSIDYKVNAQHKRGCV